jgi:c-di-GMP-binding flagellar brake protein YcgR
MAVGIIFNDSVSIIADYYDYSSKILTIRGQCKANDQQFQAFRKFIENNKEPIKVDIIEDNKRRMIGPNGEITDVNYNYDNEGNVSFEIEITF